METIAEQIEKIGPWHQSIEIAPGIKTPGHCHNLQGGIQSIGGLKGKVVYDLACNAGAHCIEACKAGAAHVLGIETRTHWLQQAHFVRRHVSERFGYQYDLQSFNLDSEYWACGAADVIIAKGILYHVANPLRFIEKICAANAFILNTAFCVQPTPSPGFMLSEEDVENPLSGICGLSWRPTGTDVLRKLFERRGFRITRAWENRKTERLEICGVKANNTQ